MTIEPEDYWKNALLDFIKNQTVFFKDQNLEATRFNIKGAKSVYIFAV